MDGWTTNKYGILGVILLFATILRVLTFGGVLGTDDISIANNAFRIIEEGFFIPDGHYSARIGLTVPLAIIFSLFGSGEIQLVIIPFFLSLVGVLLAYEFGTRVCSPKAGLLAAFLIAVFPLDVMYATRMFPDLPMGALAALSIYLAIKGSENSRPLPWLIAAGLIWGYTYLIKIEAAFIAPVILSLLLLKNFRTKHLLVVCTACLIVVLGENIYYWYETGNFLHRLKVIGSISMKVDPDMSMTSLTVFPKAWFITFYQVGLYYYFLIPAIFWAIYNKNRWLMILTLWTIVLLIWLQFGGNPLSGNYHVKSHLIRYLNIVNIPICVLISAFLLTLARKKTLYKLSLSLIIVSSLFFINYNTLNIERQKAAKIALEYARENNLSPVYADATSNAIAVYLARGSEFEDQFQSVQQHNFQTGKTEIIDLYNAQGYLLLSKESMRYASDRYYMKSLDVEKLKSEFEIIYTVNNPMNEIAYLQATLLKYIAGLLPSERLKRKISTTALEMLDDEDIIIFKLPG